MGAAVQYHVGKEFCLVNLTGFGTGDSNPDAPAEIQRFGTAAFFYISPYLFSLSTIFVHSFNNGSGAVSGDKLRLKERLQFSQSFSHILPAEADAKVIQPFAVNRSGQEQNSGFLNQSAAENLRRSRQVFRKCDRPRFGPAPGK